MNRLHACMSMNGSGGVPVVLSFFSLNNGHGERVNEYEAGIGYFQQYASFIITIVLSRIFYNPRILLFCPPAEHPLRVVAEQYKASETSTTVRKALAELIPQYNPQNETRAEMRELIMNMIS